MSAAFLIVVTCAGVLVWDCIRIQRQRRALPTQPVNVNVTLPRVTWTICNRDGEPVGSVSACTEDQLLTGTLICLEAQGHQLLWIERGAL